MNAIATATSSRPTNGRMSHIPCVANATPNTKDSPTIDAKTAANCAGLAEQLRLTVQQVGSAGIRLRLSDHAARRGRRPDDVLRTAPFGLPPCTKPADYRGRKKRPSTNACSHNLTSTRTQHQENCCPLSVGYCQR